MAVCMWGVAEGSGDYAPQILVPFGKLMAQVCAPLWTIQGLLRSLVHGLLKKEAAQYSGTHRD